MTSERHARLNEEMKAAAGEAFGAGFNAVVCIQPEQPLTPIYIDARGETCIVCEEEPAAPDTTWHANADTLLSILRRKRALTAAYQSGRLQIAGDMSVMARMVLNGR